MAKQDPKQKFLQEIEDTLLANPGWYGEVSRKMHSLAQKLTIARMKKDREEIQKVMDKKGHLLKHPVDVVAILPQKKPTLLQLYQNKKG